MKFLVRLTFVSIFVLSLYSCEKKTGFSSPLGGNLPSNYVYISADRVTPTTLKIVRGGTITFVNNDAVTHSFISYDTTTLITGPIAPHTSYIFAKDTTGSFPYHCIEHPSVTGLIIIE